MKKILCLVTLIILFSCDAFKPRQEFRFVFGFKNETTVSNIELRQTIEVLKKRLNNYGLQNSVKRFGEKNIEVNIKAIALDVDRVDKLISNSGKLEFWELFAGNEFYYYFQDMLLEVDETKETDSTSVVPKFDLRPASYSGSSEMFRAKVKDTAAIIALLNNKESRIQLNVEHKNVKFLWGIPGEGHLPLYAAKSNRENKAPLTGQVITYASQTYG